jgi:hypothetical protein
MYLEDFFECVYTAVLTFLIAILQSIGNKGVSTVAIGGINMQNTPQLISKSSTNGTHLDGIAVVSAIMSSAEPEKTCKDFAGIVRQYITKCQRSEESYSKEHNDTAAIIDRIVKMIPIIRQKSPLVHHITSKS